MPFVMKTNDTRPRLKAQLMQTDPNNAALMIPVDLTNATDVRFIMATPNGTVKIDKTITVVNAVEGRVEVPWLPGDTDTAGDYRGEFEVTTGTDVQTFPSEGYIAITMVEDLD